MPSKSSSTKKAKKRNTSIDCHSTSTLCKRKECVVCWNKSLAGHSQMRHWDDTNDTDPWCIPLTCQRIRKFICADCHHHFISSAQRITADWFQCGYCSGLVICPNRACLSCFNNSFASRPESIMFSEENDVDPRMIILGQDQS